MVTGEARPPARVAAGATMGAPPPWRGLRGVSVGRPVKQWTTLIGGDVVLRDLREMRRVDEFGG